MNILVCIRNKSDYFHLAIQSKDGITQLQQAWFMKPKLTLPPLYFNSKTKNAMIEIAAKWTVILFGLFFIFAGLLMLFHPGKSRAILRKAGSTNFINYAEITLRMIPAAAFILAAHLSKYPEVFKIAGWFMLCTSFVLYFVPRQMHHQFSTKAANMLKPLYFQLISPFAFAIGSLIILSLI